MSSNSLTICNINVKLIAPIVKRECIKDAIENRMELYPTTLNLFSFTRQWYFSEFVVTIVLSDSKLAYLAGHGFELHSRDFCSGFSIPSQKRSSTMPLFLS